MKARYFLLIGMVMLVITSMSAFALENYTASTNPDDYIQLDRFNRDITANTSLGVSEKGTSWVDGGGNIFIVNNSLKQDSVGNTPAVANLIFDDPQVNFCWETWFNVSGCFQPEHVLNFRMFNDNIQTTEATELQWVLGEWRDKNDIAQLTGKNFGATNFMSKVCVNVNTNDHNITLYNVTGQKEVLFSAFIGGTNVNTYRSIDYQNNWGGVCGNPSYSIDEIAIYNMSINGGQRPVSILADSINIINITPKDGTLFNASIISIDLNVSATVNYQVDLFINGTLNSSKLKLAGVTGTGFNISFSEGHFNYFFNVSNSTLFATSSTNSFIIDTITPIITFTTPNGDNNSIFNTTSITLDISVTNTNLHLSNFNITNSTGSIMFSDINTTLNGTASYSLNNVVSLFGQPDQTFTMEHSSCDILGNCAYKTATFNIDTTAPTVFNVLPLNETEIEFQLTTFSFNTSETGSCTLLFNGTGQQSISSISGSNSFTPIDFTVNQSIEWVVECGDVFGNKANSSLFVLTVKDVKQVFFLGIGQCPNDSLENVLMFTFLGSLLIGMVIVNIKLLNNIPVFNAIAGLGIIMTLALPLLGCSIIIGGLVILFGVGIMFIGSIINTD